MKPLLQQHLLKNRPGKILQTLLERHRLPQALMLTGPEGAGQTEAAEAFAMACNCSDATHKAQPLSILASSRLWGCGQCRSCRKIQVGSHPDIIRLEPIGQTLRIQQIRAMLDHVAFKPYEAQRRFVLIAEAEKMTPAAANAVLKVLEEPPHATSIILWSYRPRGVLPTIVSRCQIIRFPPLPELQLAEMLAADSSGDETLARWAAQLSGGSYALARDLMASGGDIQHRWVVDVLARIDELPLREVMAIAEMLAQDHSLLTVYLVQFKHYWHGRALAAIGAANKKRQSIAAQNSGSSLAAIACYFATERAEQKLQVNANRRMIVEAMLLDFRQQFRTKTSKAVANG